MKKKLKFSPHSSYKAKNGAEERQQDGQESDEAHVHRAVPQAKRETLSTRKRKKKQ